MDNVKEFNHDLINRARLIFYKVYVDKADETYYYGNPVGFVGCRVRIYPTSWEYEEPIVCWTNKELEDAVLEYEGR